MNQLATKSHFKVYENLVPALYIVQIYLKKNSRNKLKKHCLQNCSDLLLLEEIIIVIEID